MNQVLDGDGGRRPDPVVDWARRHLFVGSDSRSGGPTINTSTIMINVVSPSVITLIVNILCLSCDTMLRVVMVNVVLLSVITLNVYMLCLSCDIMLRVIMMNVVMPIIRQKMAGKTYVGKEGATREREDEKKKEWSERRHISEKGFSNSEELNEG